MDALGGLLEAPRARGAFALRCVMAPPWCIRVQAQSPLTFLAAVVGDLWVVPDGGDPVRLAPGDVAITRAPGHYNVSHDAATGPTVFIQPGQRCCNGHGDSLLEAMTHGVRTWGNDPNGPDIFVVGAYEHLSDISDRLLQALPPVLSLSHEVWASPLVRLLCDEVVKDEPGQAAVLDRLLDLLVTAVLRAWFAQRDAEVPGAWRYRGDRVVERAMRAIHASPSHPWTITSLASEAGASRAALARRFCDTVGEPPMTFLANWRMAMAADLLCQPGETVGTVSAKVGYSTPYAFSTAFKRVRGLSPKQHQQQRDRIGPGL